MKKQHQQYSHHKPKAWTSLDCLLTTLPIIPLSHSSLMMRSNNVLQMIDTHRLSPQTTSSSGYHSDLSSTNQSPQSIHENLPSTIEQSNSSQSEKKINKNFSRLSSFLRKQYERAKLKLISSKQPPPPPPPIKTCTKATSTTPLSYLSENNHIKAQQLSSSSSISKQNSLNEPVRSIYVHSLYDNQVKIPLKTSTSNYECYSHQPSHNNQVNYHAYRHLVSLSNYDNINIEYLSNNRNKYHHHNYVKPQFSQSYYPYKYLNKNYAYNRSTYAPLSDFISATDSAFKPIKSSQHSVCPHILEQLTPSDDPCDLEVAQYFHQTPHWSNPNYFDIHTKEIPVVLPRKTYTETLC